MNVRMRTVLMFLALLSGAGASAMAAEDETPDSVWDGVYSGEQAERGERVYRQHCESCHAADMRGGPAARGLVGMGFQYLWKDRPLAELLAAMRGKMPPGNPGSLGDAAYLDILAAILQRNGFPSGAAELPADGQSLQRALMHWGRP
jgi:mono/diheme cytochrome c family protein